MSGVDMSVAGDEDQWMLLERASSEGLPIIVRSRINPTIEKFSETHSVIALICDVRPNLVRDDGMPLCMSELYELEDQIVSLVADTDKQAFHTASATGDARRVIYFASERGTDFDAIVSTLVQDVVIVSASVDFDFKTYRDFVSPTDLDRQLDGDRKVIAALEEHGDQLDVPRSVEFFFYGERSALEVFLEETKTHGFTLGIWLDDPIGMMLNRLMSAEITEFRQLTPYLVDLAQRLGISYDGWGTPMATAKALEINPPKPSLFAKLFGPKKQ